MTAIELLNEGKAALSEVTDEYELDAWYLFEHATGIARHEYLMDSQITVPNEKCNIFREYISKRSKHIPLQHIVGTQWFMGLEFEVNEHVLIPRQDTEVLVEEALKVIRDGDKVLDMCDKFLADKEGIPVESKGFDEPKEIVKLVKERSGTETRKCMVCGKCSGRCPVYDQMDIKPHQFVTMIEKGEITTEELDRAVKNILNS